jgi:hypothetical protein
MKNHKSATLIGGIADVEVQMSIVTWDQFYPVSNSAVFDNEESKMEKILNLIIGPNDVIAIEPKLNIDDNNEIPFWNRNYCYNTIHKLNKVEIKIIVSCQSSRLLLFHFKQTKYQNKSVWRSAKKKRARKLARDPPNKSLPLLLWSNIFRHWRRGIVVPMQSSTMILVDITLVISSKSLGWLSLLTVLSDWVSLLDIQRSLDERIQLSLNS